MREILKCEWRSARDVVGIVLVESTLERKQAYIGIALSSDPLMDAQYIADYGARLSFEEAAAFFPELKREEYG
jgi:hypothetical protein